MKKYSMEDIAKMCGVSRGTVNRVVYNKPGVKPEKREMILKVIDEVNYIPDRNALNLVSGKSNSIGVVLHNINTEYSSMLIRFLEETCDEKGYFTFITFSNNDPEKQDENLKKIIEYNVDGLILLNVSNDKKWLDVIKEKEIPVVQAVYINESADTDKVYVDDYAAIKNNTLKMIENGHKKIMYINTVYGKYQFKNQEESKFNKFVSDMRLNGYKDALKENGIEIREDYIYDFYDYELEKTDYHNVEERDINQILSFRDRPTAIVCRDDYTAMWLMLGLRVNGVKYPEEVSITGYDYMDAIKFLDVQLCTAKAPLKDMAKTCVDMLLEQMEGRKATKTVVFNAEYIDGNSIKKIN